MRAISQILRLPLVGAWLLLVSNRCVGQSNVVYCHGPVSLNAGSTTEVDLNQDGIADYRLNVGVLAGMPSPGLPSSTTPYLDTFSFNRNDYLMNSDERIVLKPKGATFGPEHEPGEHWGHRTSEAQSIAYASGNSWPGFVGQPPEAFLGVRFLVDGAPHFGWIRFVLSDTNSAAAFPVIADWAYESRTNAAISASTKTHKQ